MVGVGVLWLGMAKKLAYPSGTTGFIGDLVKAEDVVPPDLGKLANKHCRRLSRDPQFPYRAVSRQECCAHVRPDMGRRGARDDDD
jgi:hypothetical protein